MEDYLDAISRCEAEHVKYLDSFYFGDGQPGLKRRLETKEKEIDPRVMSRFEVGLPAGSSTPIVLRVGKYGPFLEHGERKASLPDGMAPDELTLTACRGTAGAGVARRGTTGILSGHAKADLPEARSLRALRSVRVPRTTRRSPRTPRCSRA